MNCKDCKHFNIYNDHCFRWDYKVAKEYQEQGCDDYEEEEKTCATCEYCDNGVCALCNAKIPDNVNGCELWEDVVPF